MTTRRTPPRRDPGRGGAEAAPVRLLVQCARCHATGTGMLRKGRVQVSGIPVVKVAGKRRHSGCGGGLRAFRIGREEQAWPTAS